MTKKPGIPAVPRTISTNSLTPPNGRWMLEAFSTQSGPGEPSENAPEPEPAPVDRLHVRILSRVKVRS